MGLPEWQPSVLTTTSCHIHNLILYLLITIWQYIKIKMRLAYGGSVVESPPLKNDVGCHIRKTNGIIGYCMISGDSYNSMCNCAG